MSTSAFQSLKAIFSPSDEQFMWRVQMQDDTEAFAELVRRWEGPLRSLCARMTGDVHRAEDLAQEAFTRLFLRRKSYRAEAKFSTYLWRIAINLCYDELRRARRRPDRPGRELEDEQDDPFRQVPDACPAPDEDFARQEAGEAVREALMELPETHRTVVVLRHYEDLKFREIAEVLGIPEGTVKTRMTEALNDLARRLRRSLELKVAPPHGRRVSRRTDLPPNSLQRRVLEASCAL
jgi:RNA polymerase sigma-70 factor (ECF subfamily)